MKATKLVARKSPRLYPIWDSVVSEVLGTERPHLNPVREASGPTAGRCIAGCCRSAGGRPSLGDLGTAGVRCDRVDGWQEPRPR
ncbi:DUF6308 family protein [Rhodococcus sp. USK13]|uniref:DUF6308 family protein n=1 Tax=Rhodococcus sp. USK13 TaxID=2806442 RepID=UPI0032D5AEF6